MDADEVEKLRRLVLAASSAVGPCGRAQAIRSSEARGAKTIITTCASAALQHWPVARGHHVLRLVVDHAKAHVQRHASGGWLFVNLCLRVTLALLGLVDDPGGGAAQARAAALHGVALAAEWLCEALDDADCACRRRLEWSELPDVLALLRSSLSKPIAISTGDDLRHMSVLILQAFLHLLPSDAAAEWSAKRNLRYAWFCGPESAWSSLLHGVVLDTPAALAMDIACCSRDSRIVLFDVSLEQWLPGGISSGLGVDGYAVEAACATATMAPAVLREWELGEFRRLADALLAARVGVLACQKLVDPWLSDYLRQRGVSVLSRLSLRHVEHVQRLTGAVPVTSLAALPERWEEVCGAVGPIEQRTICERTYTVLRSREAPVAGSAGSHEPEPVLTLMVGAPDERCLAELKRCVPQAVRSLQDAAATGAVLVGGGLAELHLADALRARMRKELGAAAAGGGRGGTAVAACAAAEVVADALLEAALSLHADATHARASLGAMRAALDEMGRTGAMPQGAVLEVAASKRQTLLGALDLAGILVRLGDVLDFRDGCIG